MVKYLASIIRSVANSTDKREIEEYSKGLFNTCDVPQSSAFLPSVIKEAKAKNLKVKKTDDSVTISIDRNTWIRFNLYECDEPDYGEKGDLNSIDMTQNVYDELTA